MKYEKFSISNLDKTCTLIINSMGFLHIVKMGKMSLQTTNCWLTTFIISKMKYFNWNRICDILFFMVFALKKQLHVVLALLKLPFALACDPSETCETVRITQFTYIGALRLPEKNFQTNNYLCILSLLLRGAHKFFNQLYSDNSYFCLS